MKFGPVPLAHAAGTVLAHSLREGGLVLRKGALLTGEHLEALALAGVSIVTVARAEPGDLGEDAAAARLAAALSGPGLRASKAQTGRVNLYAEGHGILRIDRTRVDAINAVHPDLTLATLPEWARVGPGAMLATIKIIPYATPEALVMQAEGLATGALALLPPLRHRVVLIQTRTRDALSPKAAGAMRARLRALGVEAPMRVVTVAHEEAALAAAIAAEDAEVVLIFTASATSDTGDVAPAALRRAGGVVDRFGMPVDPGNLLFIGRRGDQVVIGLPGCAKSPALNGADWVLDRVICGVAITGADIAAMGVGGLLKEIPVRGRAREP